MDSCVHERVTRARVSGPQAQAALTHSRTIDVIHE